MDQKGDFGKNVYSPSKSAGYVKELEMQTGKPTGIISGCSGNMYICKRSIGNLGDQPLLTMNLEVSSFGCRTSLFVLILRVDYSVPKC